MQGILSDELTVAYSDFLVTFGAEAEVVLAQNTAPFFLKDLQE